MGSDPEDGYQIVERTVRLLGVACLHGRAQRHIARASCPSVRLAGPARLPNARDRQAGGLELLPDRRSGRAVDLEALPTEVRRLGEPRCAPWRGSNVRTGHPSLSRGHLAKSDHRLVLGETSAPKCAASATQNGRGSL